MMSDKNIEFVAAVFIDLCTPAQLERFANKCDRLALECQKEAEFCDASMVMVNHFSAGRWSQLAHLLRKGGDA